MNYYEKHPIIVEYRKILGEKMPNFLELLIYFKWDEGKYKEELTKFNSQFENIELELDKVLEEEDQIKLSSLKEQLMEMIPPMEIIYRYLINSLSKEDWVNFNKRSGKFYY